jgi:hypothetical protein
MMTLHDRRNHERQQGIDGGAPIHMATIQAANGSEALPVSSANERELDAELDRFPVIDSVSGITEVYGPTRRIGLRCDTGRVLRHVRHSDDLTLRRDCGHADAVALLPADADHVRWGSDALELQRALGSHRK